MRLLPVVNLKYKELHLQSGDNVEFEIEKNNQTVITNILDRKTYLKRPRVSNVTQIVFVISPKMPIPNLYTLDKGLCFAKFLGLKSLIVINKTDLDESFANNLYDIYTKTGYKCLLTKAERGEGIGELKKELKEDTNVLSRTVRSPASLLLQIAF